MYIIMCGGNYTKWEKPRQLYEINGEPIVARTIRLLKENGADEIYISSDNPDFEEFAPVLYHNNRYEAYGSGNNGRWTDCFYPTDVPVTYLFGDVVFSPEAIRTIINTKTDNIEFFASAPPFDKRYIKRWAEPFALKVQRPSYLKMCIRMVEQLQKDGCFHRQPIMWELWQVIKCTPLNEIDYTNYTVINDYTCDVDSLADLYTIQAEGIG